MQKIYLARPGAQKEGPFTLEQINHDLATKKIRDTDFWAWHEGLPAWTPLHSVPGVSAKAWVVAVPEASTKSLSADAAAEPPVKQGETRPVVSLAEAVSATRVRPESPGSKGEANGITVFKKKTENTPDLTPVGCMVATEPEVSKADPALSTGTQVRKSDSAPQPAVEGTERIPTVEVSIGSAVEEKPEQPGSDTSQRLLANPEAPVLAAPLHSADMLATPSMASGKPFSALKQVFLFTTGEGPTAFKSQVTNAMLTEAVGRNVHDIQGAVPVDVIGGTSAAVVKAIRSGSIPGSAWRALYRIKHALARQVQAGAYHLCVRTFSVESEDLVAVFLLYSKEAH